MEFVILGVLPKSVGLTRMIVCDIIKIYLLMARVVSNKNELGEVLVGQMTFFAG